MPDMVNEMSEEMGNEMRNEMLNAMNNQANKVMESDLALLAPNKSFSEHLPIQFEGIHLIRIDVRINAVFADHHLINI